MEPTLKHQDRVPALAQNGAAACFKLSKTPAPPAGHFSTTSRCGSTGVGTMFNSITTELTPRSAALNKKPPQVAPPSVSEMQKRIGRLPKGSSGLYLGMHASGAVKWVIPTDEPQPLQIPRRPGNRSRKSKCLFHRTRAGNARYGREWKGATPVCGRRENDWRQRSTPPHCYGKPSVSIAHHSPT